MREVLQNLLDSCDTLDGDLCEARDDMEEVEPFDALDEAIGFLRQSRRCVAEAMQYAGFKS